MAARQARAIVMTKDGDFTRLLDLYGAPPKVILLTCGNTANAMLKHILSATLAEAMALLAAHDSLVEIRGI